MKTNQTVLLAALSLTALSALSGCAGLHNQIQGHWLSAACETRPAPNGGKIYIKRDFTVQESSWFGYFSYYAEDSCQTLTSVGYAEGPYTLGNPVTTPPDGNEGQFVLAKLKITPKLQGTADYLNTAAAGTCGTQAWAVNAEQDVTPTHGCSVLGVDLSTCGTEYEIVKVESDKLYFGARPADGSNLCTADKRPTAWQVPLARSNP